jgi:hypothetical protein
VIQVAQVDRIKLKQLFEREVERFVREHPVSKVKFAAAQGPMMGGVPMSWMAKWPGGYPVYVATAKGSRFTDVDGIEYVDFCLGDTGAMVGHSPDASVAAIARQLAQGITLMLPTEDATVAAQTLADRFGVEKWQFTLTATDANRHILRYARHVTGRSKIVVHDYCYHGTVDETFANLDDAGNTVSRENNIGPQVDPAETTIVVPFNDLAAAEAAFASGDVAAMLIEPAMTNIGIILPDPGYHDALRELTRKADVFSQGYRPGTLGSRGFSPEALLEVTAMLEFSDPNWEKQFKTGKGGPANKQNYETDPWFERNTNLNADIDSRRGKQPGDQGKLKENIDSEMLSPVSYPKGPGNPQGGSSKEVQGMRMLG